MSNFKIGEKVVCKKHDSFCVDTLEFLPSPKKGEIVTVDWISKDGKRIGFEEYSEEDCWDSCDYRKLDYEFADNILAEITEAMKSEIILN